MVLLLLLILVLRTQLALGSPSLVLEFCFKPVYFLIKSLIKSVDGLGELCKLVCDLLQLYSGNSVDPFEL